MHLYENIGDSLPHGVSMMSCAAISLLQKLLLNAASSASALAVCLKNVTTIVRRHQFHEMCRKFHNREQGR
jgi:hypothetical protein